MNFIKKLILQWFQFFYWNFLDKLTEIERANRILLEKMSMIMNSEESLHIPRAARVNQTISGIGFHNISRDSSENNN